MQELRVEHLGARPKKTTGPTVREELGAAYLAAVAKAERRAPKTSPKRAPTGSPRS